MSDLGILITTKNYLQTTATECGLACLGYIAAKYGSQLEMGELRARYAISLQGATLQQLMAIASNMGFISRPLRLELQELKDLRTPCLLHWNLNHYVVLLSVKKQGVVIHDPAHGERLVNTAEVSRSFTGVAVELTESPNFEPLSPRPKIAIRKLVGKITGIKRSLTQLIILAVGIQMLSLITPMIIQWVVDGAVVSGDKNFLIVLAIGFALVAITKVILECVRGWISLSLAYDFHIQWASKVIDHLFKLPLSWYELRHVGDISSRIDSIRSIQQTLTGKVVDIFLDGTFGVLLLVVMFIYSPLLTTVVLIALALYMLVRILPHGHFHRANEEALIQEAKASTHFLESIRAAQAIKLGKLENQRRITWTNLFSEGAIKRISAQKMSIGFSAGYGLIFALESIVVLGLAASMAIDGIFTIGMLMAFLSFKDDFVSRAQRLIDNGMAVRMLSLHIERLSDIILTEKERVDSEPSGYSPGAPITIDLINVSYRYSDMSPWVIRNFNLSIKPGENVAIVGPSGCGKTTLAKLILGLLKPTEGEIIVCGQPLEKFGIHNWRALVGAVMQEDQLFSGSLQDNIANFTQVDQDYMRKCAKFAAVDDEINTMPMGYLTLNGDMGSSLSGGQKQRILMARALYKKPQVLVLDEATSHLDVVKERAVNNSVSELKITRITVAHRPETILMADRVVDIAASTSSKHVVVERA